MPTIRFLLSYRHDDVIKWKYYPRYCPLCGEFTGHRWIPRTKGQWRGALMFSVICIWINGWINNREAGDLRRHRDYYDVIVMDKVDFSHNFFRHIFVLWHSTPLSRDKMFCYCRVTHLNPLARVYSSRYKISCVDKLCGHEQALLITYVCRRRPKPCWGPSKGPQGHTPRANFVLSFL